ncbi:MAG: M50 family metallopeptidase [Nanoarchaeota archaeon]|jgi:membrane-associated protease RseP (regulator of RpoE activity)|nr:M50 family metallopeptidase [Nanoarchaeota archaeon]
MDKLMIFDLSLLAAFVIFVGLFLYNNRTKLTKEGWLWLYHTSWGLKIIKKIGKKYEKCLKVSSYVSVTLGYFLMAVMIWLFGKIVWIYAFHGDLVKSIKLPPIMPLIPYLPQIFKLDFLPPFYFSYWIIILAVIAITHELFHGIYAAVYKVDTKTTGFGFFPFFFPIFLAAFVNLNEKIMAKKSSFKQRAVLSAGTFANVLTAIVGLILMWGFFSLTFSPVGVVFDDYAYNDVNVSSIESINGLQLEFNGMSPVFGSNDGKMVANGTTYFALKATNAENSIARLYYDAPAIAANLTGPIMKINGETISSLEKLTEELSKYSPGETISITTYEGEEQTKQITLAENPLDSEKAWLGISFLDKTPSGLIGKVSAFTVSYKKPSVYYMPSSDAAKFIYDLLWWLVLISFSVALVNMLPMGIFDGGRFFYLTILTFTKSEKAAEKGFKWMTQLLLFALLVVMFFWAKNLF